ncbi:MAG: EAL domain-containing protein [Treponema sp.]|nr:EAL domain-containing protein [Candidatus Treponema equifaecale]
MKSFKRIITYVLIVIAVAGISHGVISLTLGYINSVQKNGRIKEESSLSGKQVLYITSYNNSYNSVDSQLKGIHGVLTAANIGLDVQCMDMQTVNSELNLQLFHDTLKLKFSKQMPYDAVILGDDFALSFAMDYQEELFKDVPLVFLGVRDEKLVAEASKNPHITGCREISKIQDTVEIAMKFNPAARMIYALYDDSSLGIEKQTEFFALKSKYPGYLFRGIDASECTREAFGKIISAIESRTIVVYLCVSEDRDGNTYNSSETVEFISHRSKVPVFTESYTDVGKGFVGGKVMNYEEMGRRAAQTVKDIVDGSVDISLIAGSTVLESEYLFDNDVMKKFGMSEKVLEENSAYLNKTLNYWLMYRTIILPFAEIFTSIFILIGILIIYLIELNASRKQISYSAKHDTLTGLLNRYSILKKISEVIDRRIDFTVLLVDIDDFRSINDFNTHKCGDAVLKELSKRLKNLSDDGNYEVSRYDGDNFLLIYKGAHLEKNDPEIYFLRQLLSNAIEYEDKTLFIFTSIGIVNSNPNFTVDDYLANADIAMNAAKKQGRNKYVLFTDDMKQVIKENAEIGEVLEEACKNEEFTVLYQPQIDATTGLISGYEALVRLSKAQISPGLFIPIAEKDGHISKIGRIVTEKVLKQMAEWRDSGLELKRVSLNYSAAQTGDKGYIPYLRRLMKTYDIPAEYLGIEITESLFLGNKTQASELFNQFDELGIKIALDDFGTGYSSLNYLTYLPIQTVKLDKSTVDTYLDGQATFIENIVKLVHSLGMKLTVEGVEEKWQYDKLKSFKCDFIQGYFFSKPLTGEEILSFVPQKVE